MEIVEHINSVSEQGRSLASAAEEAGPGATVPTCPGWQVRNLLRHTGMVHRWATAFVAEGHTEYHPDGGEPDLDGAELLAWFREGHGRLTDALKAAPDDLDCWTFLPAPSPLAFWARRQAHETTIHRVDAESARGGPLSPSRTPWPSTGSTNWSPASTPGRRAECGPTRHAPCGCASRTRTRRGPYACRPAPAGRTRRDLLGTGARRLRVERNGRAAVPRTLEPSAAVGGHAHRRSRTGPAVGGELRDQLGAVRPTMVMGGPA